MQRRIKSTPEHSQVAFNVCHLVSQAHGLFNEFSGQIEFDPEHPEKTRVEATIVVSSIDTDHEKRDAHLRSADFFDVESFPSMTFKSNPLPGCPNVPWPYVFHHFRASLSVLSHARADCSEQWS